MPSTHLLTNADWGLAPTADSIFESALVDGIMPNVGVNFSTHLPTAVGRLSLRRLVGRCVLKIGRCVPALQDGQPHPPPPRDSGFKRTTTLSMENYLSPTVVALMEHTALSGKVAPLCFFMCFDTISHTLQCCVNALT